MLLSYFGPISIVCTSWNRQKTSGCSMYPWNVEGSIGLKTVDNLNKEITNIRNNMNIKSTAWIYGKYTKCRFHMSWLEHTNNISIFISDKITQQFKNQFAVIKFQNCLSDTSIRHHCKICFCWHVRDRKQWLRKYVISLGLLFSFLLLVFKSLVTWRTDGRKTWKKIWRVCLKGLLLTKIHWLVIYY